MEPAPITVLSRISSVPLRSGTDRSEKACVAVRLREDRRELERWLRPARRPCGWPASGPARASRVRHPGRGPDDAGARGRAAARSGVSWLTFSLLLVVARVDGLSQRPSPPEPASIARLCRLCSRTSSTGSRGSDPLADGPPARPRARHARRTRPARRGHRGPRAARARSLRGLTARERARLHTLLERLVRDDRPAFLRG